jgi:hypothetical protein
MQPESPVGGIVPKNTFGGKPACRVKFDTRNEAREREKFLK